MTFHPDEKLAIFIDGANFYSTAKSLDFDIDYKNLLNYFSAKGRMIKAFYFTALRENDDFSPLRPLLDWLDYNGFHIITKKAKSFTDRDGRTRFKGDMDVEIVVKMLELALHVDHMLLFSGDGDFRSAVEAVQKLGVRVSVVSSLAIKPTLLADELRRQADHFIEIDDLEREVGRPKRERPDYGDDDDDFGYD
ncbi:NYN domain-containing protein [Algimonas porphyrae]|uniref:NYN domain-containing protein n=1 Tax=Algimonas porphyrae TaxID=1128113 RepID=A0ABQ5UXI1_9PROT|nr:NYN domain-containing protein [Algimonas porphyrae]GLQ20010.1 NYN domain-containing protein [Algimonas porphyrae]